MDWRKKSCVNYEETPEIFYGKTPIKTKETVKNKQFSTTLISIYCDNYISVKILLQTQVCRVLEREQSRENDKGKWRKTCIWGKNIIDIFVRCACVHQSVLLSAVCLCICALVACLPEVFLSFVCFCVILFFYYFIFTSCIFPHIECANVIKANQNKYIIHMNCVN